MRTRFQRALYSISTKSARLYRLDQLTRIAQAAQFDGIDVDTRQRRFRDSLSDVLNDDQIGSMRSTSLWMSPTRLERFLADPKDRSGLRNLLRATKGIMMIVSDEGELSRGVKRSAAFDQAARLKEVVGERHRIALGVAAEAQDGGRSHLVRMRTLRSLAEEWDVGIALDVHACADWKWEAEAAIYHTVGQLDLIRLTLPLPTFDAHVRTRVTMRTLSASIDAGFRGVYSIVPTVPFWNWLNADAIASRSAEARDLIIGMMRGNGGDAIRNDVTIRSLR